MAISKTEDSAIPLVLTDFDCDLLFVYPEDTSPGDDDDIDQKIMNGKSLLKKYIDGLLQMSFGKLPKPDADFDLGGATEVPSHTPSLLAYMHVYSKFTIGTTPVTITYAGTAKSIELFQVMGDGSGQPALKVDSGSLVIPDPSEVHQGLLLDGAQIMSMLWIAEKMRKDRDRISLRWLDPSYTNDSLQDTLDALDSELSEVTKALLGVLADSKVGLVKNLKKIGSERNTAIKLYLDPDIPHKRTAKPGSSEFSSNIQYQQGLMNAFAAIGENASAEDLAKGMYGYKAVLDGYIKAYTDCIFQGLGGVGLGLQSYTIATGAGTTSLGLFNYGLTSPNPERRNRGEVGLFSYAYKANPDNTTVPVSTLGKRKIDLSNFNEGDCKERQKVFHFNLFARDGGDRFDLSIRGFRDGEDVGTIFELRGVHFGIGQKDDDFIWKDKNDKTIAIFAGCRTDLENLDTGATNDLILLDETINSLQIELDSGVKEIVYSISSYCKETTKIVIDLDDETLFEPDRFQVHKDKKEELIFPDDDLNQLADLDEFIGQILASDSIKVDADPENFKGGFIGLMRIPFEWDSSRTNYVVDEPVMWNNKVYYCESAGSTEEPGVGLDWTESVHGLLADYQFDDQAATPTFPRFIIEDEKLYRMEASRANPQGHEAATFDPAEWEFIGNIHNQDDVNYSIGDFVVHNNRLYKAVRANSGKFNPFNYAPQAKIESDPRYNFDPSNNDAPYNLPEVGSTTNPLKQAFYRYFKYSFVDINTSGSNITFSVNSFASPVRSRLDQKLDNATNRTASDVIQLDRHTLYGQDNTSAATVAAGVASYNGVLSDLRCFGILEAVVCRINRRATAILSPTDAATVATKLDNFMTDTTTAIVTVQEAGNDMKIVYTDAADTGNSNRLTGYAELYWLASGDTASDYLDCE